jgi:N-acetylglucosaminyl-diphospho-decaprenol L-rhamnosyltransferase
VSFTIVTVLHDSAPELRRLLPSLREHLPPDAQIVMVDSGSSDDGPALARAAGAEVVVLEGNPGFGTASNAGVAAARHAVTVLLNPDCELLDAGLSELAGRAAGCEALLVPRLIEADGALQRSAHPLPGGPMALVRAVLPTRALPQPHRARRPRRVGWAIAACLAARTPLLRRLGPFDPDAFLFYEDMDLCLRAHAAGVPTVLHPEVVVRHLGGRSTAREFGGEAFELQARRRREVVGARRGARALRYDDGAQALTFGLRAAVGRERGRNVAALHALRAARRMATAAPRWRSRI